MSVGRAQLVRLTAGKAVANTALRWIPFFLPTLSSAFGASTARLTAILGFGEMAGLSTLVIGRQLDRGSERRIMVGALGVVTLSAVLALAGRTEVFALSYVVLIVGTSVYTVGGHTFLSRRVPFARRARTMGIFETSWAFALLIGAPIIALLIELFGWRGPFVAVALASAITAVSLARDVDTSSPLSDASGPVTRQRVTTDAWIVILASAAIAMAGLTTIVIAGTWLDDALGVSTGGIGLVAMSFGAAELIASASSAFIADRAGPARATGYALGALLAGLAVMTQAGDSLLIGALGLLVFFLGFEFAIVTSFSVVSEAIPTARGRALATNYAVGTVARGSGVVLSGLLYERHGIAGPAAVSAAAALAGIGLLWLGAHRSRPA